MTHSPVFKQFILLLQQARRAHLKSEGKPLPVPREKWQGQRRRVLKTLAVSGAGALMMNSLPGAVSRALASAEIHSAKIAIIGGGLAGLNAAYQLKKAGIEVSLYEASTRLGGRVFSQTGTVVDGITVEVGAEFINSDHEDMLALVQDFGLQLFDRKADAQTVPAPASAYYFDGKSWSDDELIPLLQPLVAQINHDAELLDQDWDRYAPGFDRLSVKDYLDRHAALIPQAFIRTLFDGAIRVEYGGEPEETTALQLLFLLPTIDGTTVELLGYSDEAFTVSGGNSLIIEGLRDALGSQIHLNHVLSEVEAIGNKGFELKFGNGTEIRADYLILAIPFSVLRHVKLKVPLPGKLRQFIEQADLGRNEKLLAGVTERVWRQAGGFSLDAWSDLGFSSLWDGSQRQTDRTDGVLTYYVGGDEVNAVHSWPGGVPEAGAEFTKSLSTFIPQLSEKLTGNYRGTRWTQHRFIRGGYVNYKPGQLTRFGSFFWIESDDPAERQSVHVGRLIIAGEQVSDEYYGFMNGGAQTGRLSAQLLLQMLQSEKPKANTAI